VASVIDLWPLETFGFHPDVEGDNLDSWNNDDINMWSIFSQTILWFIEPSKVASTFQLPLLNLHYLVDRRSFLRQLSCWKLIRSWLLCCWKLDSYTIPSASPCQRIWSYISSALRFFFETLVRHPRHHIYQNFIHACILEQRRTCFYSTPWKLHSLFQYWTNPSKESTLVVGLDELI